MRFEIQMMEWMEKHPDATLEEAYRAGYFQSTDNWCTKETFQRFNRPVTVEEVIKTGKTILGDYDKRIRQGDGTP